MKKTLISIYAMLVLGIGTASAQQIPMFNSYLFNRFLINPSYAGMNAKSNLFALNRIQFAGFEGAPVTYMLAGDAGFKDKKFGVGGVVFSDRNSLISQTGLQLAYAYTLKLNDQWNIGMGLNAGMVQWAMNFDQLRADDPTETVLANSRSNATTLRSDIGFRLNSDKLDFGFSLPQIVSSKANYNDYLKNSNGKYTSVPHYIVNLGYTLALKEKLKIKPTVLVRGAKGVKPQIDIIGLIDWKNKTFVSLGYRTNFAATIGAGFRLPGGFTLGYSFDRPLGDISKSTAGSHEFMVGFTFGSGSKSSTSDESKGLTKEAEAKLKADMEKQIHDKLSQEFDNKLNLELEARINKAVEEKIAKAIANLPATTPSTDGKTTPAANATISKEELEKIKKEIEEKIKKQMEESFTKTMDEKIKKAMESKPATTNTPTTPTVTKEEADRLRKESEEKIRKEVEENLKKELAEKINKAVEERMALELQKSKEAAAKAPAPEYKMTAKDKAILDSLKMKDLENEKRIVLLEKQLKSFPENDRIENTQLADIRRIVHQNDIELKKFKAENKAVLDKAADAPAKKSKTTETTDEPSKFVLVLATFKSLKEAQEYQKLGAQTFEFPNTKILKPDGMEGWFFVYQKSFDKKKEAWDAYMKIFESDSNTPKYVWIYVKE